MTINELARAVHENAVAHGWWDEERSMAEVIALIHSEWSEALEEARAGRPLVWYRCCHIAYDKICNYFNGGCDLKGSEDCVRLRGKPEGIAVELIDGCIRILDAFGKYSVECDDNEHGEPMEIESLWTDEEIPELDNTSPGTLPNLVAWLHAATSETILNDDDDPTHLLAAMCLAMKWVHGQGIDPLKLLMEKHEYNKTRPYKHGKKF